MPYSVPVAERDSCAYERSRRSYDGVPGALPRGGEIVGPVQPSSALPQPSVRRLTFPCMVSDEIGVIGLEHWK